MASHARNDNSGVNRTGIYPATREGEMFDALVRLCEPQYLLRTRTSTDIIASTRLYAYGILPFNISSLRIVSMVELT